MRAAVTSWFVAIGLALPACGEGGANLGVGGDLDGGDPVTATGPSAGGGRSATTGSGDGGGDARASSSAAGTGSGPMPAGSGGADATCLGASLLDDLDRDHVMVGASLGDGLAATTPLDVRYVYVAGALADGDGPCASCASGCTAAGVECSNQNPGGCGWWGCWQSDAEAPGAYVRSFAATARGRGQIPMVTYYVLLPSSGASEGIEELAAAADADFMARYLADFRLLLESLAGGPALVHVEPDFWGYAQQSNPDPRQIPVAVAAANPADCPDEEASLAGLGRCLVRMARVHAPEVKIGLHGSGWATGYDVLQNDVASFDVEAHAAALGGFLAATAPGADLVFVGASDRDAGFYASIGRETWWDDTNSALPHFHQAFAWSRAVSEAVGKPNLWWQLPFGNMALSGDDAQWNDNRLDYFFDHMDEVAAAHGVGVAFGAGAGDQVTAETDGGNFAVRASDYAASGGQPLCIP